MRKIVLVGSVLSVLVLFTGLFWSYVRASIERDSNAVALKALESFTEPTPVQFEKPKVVEARGLGALASALSEERMIVGMLYGEIAYARVLEGEADGLVKQFAAGPVELHGPMEAESGERIVQGFVSPACYGRMRAGVWSIWRNFGLFATYVMPVLLAVVWLGTFLGFRIARRKSKN